MAAGASELRQHIGLRSAAALVVANVIGAGIFTTTGFQAADLGDPTAIMVLWIVGGVLALCGALCYGELGAAMPNAGGEYVYLRETYGQSWGFMSAFVSCVAGFPAPIAAALKGFSYYLAALAPNLHLERPLVGVLPAGDLLAVGLVWILTFIHLRGESGIRVNDLVTWTKIAGIVAILIAAATVGKGELGHFGEMSAHGATLSESARWSALGTSLIFVMFCYSGWNAAAYVASEIRDPGRLLPRALLIGTSIVIVLYLGLNSVYLYGASVSELAGEVEVAIVAARALFGPQGVTGVTLVALISLLASASAMTIAGPRVYYALGKDVSALRRLGGVSPRTGAPSTALLVQGVVTTILILMGRVDQIQQYAGFTLALFSTLAVSALIVLRIRKPGLERPFRAWGYPITPLFFIGVSLWTMYWAAVGRPLESTLAFVTVVAGGLIFAALRHIGPSRS
jgi:APA family basic amino acid/polyamine antiporter